MHMQLLHNDRVTIFDRTEFGPTNLTFPNGDCPTTDCTAHSAEYSVLDNSYRPLTVLTNTWCSSGGVFPDGKLVQTGGFNTGDRMVREFTPCDDGTCDWQELGSRLLRRRWYATNHMLPDGSMIVIGGTRQFNYEFYPKSNTLTNSLHNLPFLAETTDPGVENNLYPFVFLNVDGNLFIFANNRAILYDYSKSTVVKSYPTIPGGDPRNYPSTGSAVLLPLKNLDGNGTIAAEVLVCGGAPRGSLEKANRGEFVGALDTCARININDANPQWAMETMPSARVMGDMVLLPNGNVLLINGAGSGAAGWEIGRDPVLSPVIYKPDASPGSRFEVQNPSTRPRMYHSTAILVRDGSVLVGGSNAHRVDTFTNVLFPTEYSLEAFSPSYMNRGVRRPRIFFPLSNQMEIKYGESVVIGSSISGSVNINEIKVTMVAPSFNTHSFSQNQRLVELTVDVPNVVRTSSSMYQIEVKAPSNANQAPPGYYMLFVVYNGIPSEGIWVLVD